ncbi:MAG: hypothetical protein WB791_02340 [Waddliaceae bacterium]
MSERVPDQHKQNLLLENLFLDSAMNLHVKMESDIAASENLMAWLAGRLKQAQMKAGQLASQEKTMKEKVNAVMITLSSFFKESLKARWNGREEDDMPEDEKISAFKEKFSPYLEAMENPVNRKLVEYSYVLSEAWNLVEKIDELFPEAWIEINVERV